jgi:hypothetical protein
MHLNDRFVGVLASGRFPTGVLQQISALYGTGVWRPTYSLILILKQ